MENVNEFLRDEETASVTFSQRRFITRIRKLAEKYPDQARILAENEDGSVFAHVPVRWIRISPPKETAPMSEIDKLALRSKLLRGRLEAQKRAETSEGI